MRIFQKIRNKLVIGWRLSRLIELIELLLPIQNKKIVFNNFLGKGYGDDPKYICEALRKIRSDLDLVWLTDPQKNREQLDLPAEVRCVAYGSCRALYELTTAHIWISNVKNSMKPPKRSGQFYLQTWHSFLGIKRNEQTVEQKLSPEYVLSAKRDAAMTDLMYSNNDIRLALYRNHYWYRGPVIKCGVPHCGLYLKPEKMAWAGTRVREYFSLDADTQIILYAPTFRGYAETTEMLLDFQRCLEIFAEQGKRHDDTASAPKKYVLLWRLHPNLANRCREQIQNPSVVNATNYPDIYELVAACDILISDYSACIFDGALAGKPVFLYTPDLQQYCKDDRALAFSPQQLPFSFSMNHTQLKENVESFSMADYQKKCRQFFCSIGLVDDGTGAEVLAQRILDQIKEYER